MQVVKVCLLSQLNRREFFCCAVVTQLEFIITTPAIQYTCFANSIGSVSTSNDLLKQRLSTCSDTFNEISICISNQVAKTKLINQFIAILN